MKKVLFLSALSLFGSSSIILAQSINMPNQHSCTASVVIAGHDAGSLCGQYKTNAISRPGITAGPTFASVAAVNDAPCLGLGPGWQMGACLSSGGSSWDAAAVTIDGVTIVVGDPAGCFSSLPSTDTKTTPTCGSFTVTWLTSGGNFTILIQ